MMPDERRFEIKRIQMTRRPAHEQLNHPLRFRRMMQCAAENTVGQQRLSPQHRRQRQPAQATTGLPKEIAPVGDRGALSLMERRIVHAQGKIERIWPLLQQLYHRFAHALADEVVGFGVVVPVIALTAG